ncbi:hypothetical protein [Thiomicrorhabdus heinhorstiae]|uniref:DUF2846 domain-containing protein n=1 Tax=Thiomicrorhabdus heinhorstiae TaxID=2748010 RepID=A0ABS0BYK6_9GAMM|nr:hypothetical protein [Thiomicrorhabdus heinhorstiae]MBF6058864.1 hypothetical protein [Thiomicrorhabdus heinhorstiae]
METAMNKFRNSITTIATLIIFASFLGGCASNEAITKELTESAEFIPPNNKALITGSVSMYGGHFGWFTLKNTTTGETQTVGAINADDEYSWNARTGRGRTYLLELDPGLYEIIDWEYKVFVLGGTQIITPKNMKPIALNLKAGDQFYLGDFNFEMIVGKNIFGLNVPASVKVKVRDKRTRDLNNLKKKFPHLVLSDIKNYILNYAQ